MNTHPQLPTESPLTVLGAYRTGVLVGPPVVRYPGPLRSTLTPSNRSGSTHTPSRVTTGSWPLAMPPHLRGSDSELLPECPETGLIRSRTGVLVPPTIVGYLRGQRSNLGPSNRLGEFYPGQGPPTRGHTGAPDFFEASFEDRYETEPSAFSVTFGGLDAGRGHLLVVARGHTRRTPLPPGGTSGGKWTITHSWSL